jgi:hypothetical protein
MELDLEDSRRKLRFLETLYEAVSGKTEGTVTIAILGRMLGMTPEQVADEGRWFVANRLARFRNEGQALALQFRGQKVVRDAKDDPRGTFAPFPFPYSRMVQEEPDDLDTGASAGVGANVTPGEPAPGAGDTPAGPGQPPPQTGTMRLSADLLLQERIDIASRVASDVRAKHDALGFDVYVAAVASFLVNPQTSPPLTLTIEGGWGTGKSSFMLQLRESIERLSQPSQDAVECICVDFSPWHHADDEKLWAAFAVGFMRDISQHWSQWARLKAWFRLLGLRALRRESLPGVVRAAALAVGSSAIFLVAVMAVLYLGPGWVDAFMAIAGTTSALADVSLKAGGVAALLCFGVLCAARVWPHMRRALAMDYRGLVSAPNYTGKIPFIEHFHKDFPMILKAYTRRKRVFVFVDDIDRCAPPQAASIMRAIGLLPEHEQLVLVLGLDREKVAAAIAAAYRDVIPFLGNTGASWTAAKAEVLAGLEFGRGFIEKFVQLPFAVPIPDQPDLETYVESLAGSRDTSEAAAPVVSSDPQGRLRGDEDNSRFQPFLVRLTPGDSAAIRQLTAALALPLGRNPRRIKQFLNLVRLRTYIGYTTGLLGGEEAPSWSLSQLGKLVALELLWPNLPDRLDRDPELLARLEQVAISSPQEAAKGQQSAEKELLDARPDILALLRLGCADGAGMPGLRGPCSFQGLDVRRALLTAPRVRDAIHLYAKELAANVSVSGSVSRQKGPETL